VNTSTLSENTLTKTSSVQNVGNVRRISQSEVTTWLSCRAKYRYEYDMDLEPVTSSEALSKGNLGHDVLEVYYRCLMDGAAQDDAITEARKVYMGALDTYGMEIIAAIDPLLQGYWRYYPSDEFEILAVEELFDLPVTEEFSMPSRLDLIVRRKKDRKMGIIDHKFMGEFPTPQMVNLNGQQIKYRFLMTALDYPIEFATLNVIRTRKMKDPSPEQLYRRFDVPTSVAKTQAVLRQQIVASKEIVRYREQPEDVRKNLAVPVLNTLVCKFCSFKELCSSEMDGGDIEYLIANEFQQKESYGYNFDEQDKVKELL